MGWYYLLPAQNMAMCRVLPFREAHPSPELIGVSLLSPD